MVNVVQKRAQIFKNDVLRFPRLDTVLMIEETIQKSKRRFDCKTNLEKAAQKSNVANPSNHPGLFRVLWKDSH